MPDRARGSQRIAAAHAQAARPEATLMLRSPVALMTAAIAGVDGFMVSAQSFVRAHQVAAHRGAAVSHVDQLLARRSAESLS